MARIETAVARNLAAYVAAYREVAPEVVAEAIEVAGGVAAYCGTDSPLTTVKGLGAQLGAGDCERIEQFFRQRSASAVTIECAPWLSESSCKMLEQRGYQVSLREHVVLRKRLLPDEQTLQVESLPVEDWPEVMRRGFELPDTAAMGTLVNAAAVLEHAQLWGIRESAGTWIACAQSVTYDNVAIFGCDGTLPEARGRGAQRALIVHRLREIASEMLITAEVAPGSVSERNYLRCGFEVAYARTHYVRQLH
jgi:GNAT superfamily N-acetyltransferase